MNAIITATTPAESGKTLPSKEAYVSFTSEWKRLCRTGSEPGAAVHVLRNALLGLDPARGFTQKTNPNKLGNGMAPWGGFLDAARDAQRGLRLGFRPSGKESGMFHVDEATRVFSFCDVPLDKEQANQLVAILGEAIQSKEA